MSRLKQNSAILFAAFALVCGAQQTNPAFVEPADIPGLPRVLLIGDSISIGYTPFVRELLKGKANVHRIPENGAATIHGLEKIDGWLGDSKWDVIHFNWGLHDLKLMEGGNRQVSPDDYEKNLRQLVERLKRTGARLIFATTTPVPEGKVSPPRVPADVALYNAAARRVMADSNVAIDDLNAAIQPKTSLQLPVNVHFTPEGYQALAEAAAQSILAALK